MDYSVTHWWISFFLKKNRVIFYLYKIELPFVIEIKFKKKNGQASLLVNFVKSKNNSVKFIVNNSLITV